MQPPGGLYSPSRYPLQYLLLRQLLLDGLAVADGHGLDFLLPLPRLPQPADEPLVAAAIGLHVAAQQVELALPQVELSEHGLPALQEAVDQLTVVLQFGIALAVHPGHLVADGRRAPQLILQPVEHRLVGLGFSAHGLSVGRGGSKESKSHHHYHKQEETGGRSTSPTRRTHLQEVPVVLHLLLFSRHFADVAQTSLVTLQRVLCLLSVSDHNVDGLQP